MSTALSPVALTSTGLQSGYVSSGVVPEPDPPTPILTSPTGTNTGMYSAIGSVVTDTANGVLYFITTTSPTATASAVKAGNTQPVSAAGKQDIAITGLTHTTGYYNHFLQRSGAGIDSLVVSSAAWATEAPVVGVASLALNNAVLHALKNNTGSVYANQPYRCLIVKQSTGDAVAVQTGTTTAAGLIGVLTIPGLVLGEDYYVVIEVGAGGAYGTVRVSAA